MNAKYPIVSCAVFAALAVPAAAENAAPDTGIIETVVVTAQKREQNPIDVPFALTAYSGDFLANSHLQDFDKLSLFVPGFTVQDQSPNNPGFVMRGITSDSNDSTQEPRVSVFADGVPASQSRGSYFELFDVARVEVAKGPQSTLFGRSALIGAVNVVTNRADPEKFDASLSGEYGDFAYRMIEGMANIPVSDDFAVRISGRYKARNGYVKNLLGGDDFNSVDTGAARLSAHWAPSKAFTADFIFNFEKDKPSGTSFKSGTFVPTDPETGAAIGNLGRNSGAALSTFGGFENGRKLGLDRTLYSGALLTETKIDAALTLASITAYRRYDSEEVFDPDGSSLPIMAFAEDARGDQFSHEFRLNYESGGRLSAFGGASYFYESNSSRVPMLFDEPMALALLTGQIAVTPPPDGFFSSAAYTYGYAPAFLQGLAGAYGAALDGATAAGISANLDPRHWEQYETWGKTKSVDFYGDMTYRVADTVELDAGLRFTHDDKESAYAAKTDGRSILGGVIGALSVTDPATKAALLGALGSRYVSQIPYAMLPNFGIATQPTANDGDKISRPYHDNGFAWRLTARYAPNENSSLYATYARGRRPKVLAASSPDAPYADPNFSMAAAETVDSYEAGYKTLTLDGRLRLDAAVYYYTYDNFQTIVLENTAQVTANAGKAHAYGTELSADWAIASWANFFGTYTYSHARFAGDTLYHGNRFRLTPDQKLSAGLDLRAKALGGTFTLTPTWTWQSKIYFDDDNDIAALQTGHIRPDTNRDEFQGDYGLANLRLGYRPEGGIWSASLFATNLFDRKFIKDAGNTGDYFGIPTFIAGEPRFVGMSVSVKMP